MAPASKISVVTDRGQISIPAPLRKELGLQKGQRLLWERSGDHEIRVVVLPDAEPQGAVAMLGFARRFRAVRRSQEWMTDLREGED